MSYIKKFNSKSALLEYVQTEIDPEEFICVVADNSFIHLESGEPGIIRTWETLLYEGEAGEISL